MNCPHCHRVAFPVDPEKSCFRCYCRGEVNFNQADVDYLYHADRAHREAIRKVLGECDPVSDSEETMS